MRKVMAVAAVVLGGSLLGGCVAYPYDSYGGGYGYAPAYGYVPGYAPAYGGVSVYYDGGRRRHRHWR
jgi:hypothetical protein